MNTLQRLILRRVIAEIAADTIAAYGISGALSPIGDGGHEPGGSGSTPSIEKPYEETDDEDDLEEISEEDLLSFTKADRELDNRGKQRLWRR